MRGGPRPTITDDEVNAIIARGKPYTVVLLKAGPRSGQHDATAQQIQAAHLRHLMELRTQGHLLVNGPFPGHGELRGLSIYASTNSAQVQAWVKTDPGVISGRLAYEILPWFGIPGDSLR